MNVYAYFPNFLSSFWCILLLRVLNLMLLSTDELHADQHRVGHISLTCVNEVTLCLFRPFLSISTSHPLLHHHLTAGQVLLTFCIYHYIFSNYQYRQFSATLTYLLTPWCRVLLDKLAGIAASQEIPRILWNPKVHYRIHKLPPPVPILG